MTQTRSGDDFGLRLGALFACLFFAIGIQFPFFPLWLKTRGLDAEAIGIVLAVPIVIRIVAVPVISRAVDRTGDLRAGLILTSFGSAIGFAIVGMAYGFGPILLAVALASLAAAPTVSLADAYALKGLALRHRAYGPLRLWGSIAFIAANLGTGLLLNALAPGELIWLIVAAFSVLGLSTLFMARIESTPLAPTGEARSAAVGHLWQSPQFLAIAVAASLIQASHALYYGFSTVDCTTKGLSGTTIGILWALGVAAEIVLFACSGRLALSPFALVGLGAAGAVIRWLAMAFDPALPILAAVQCLHGLSFGATHLGAIQFVARLAGDRKAAAAQGDFATLLAIGNAAATGGSGLLYGTLGDYGYVVMAAIAGAGAASLCLARRMQLRPRNRSDGTQ